MWTPGWSNVRMTSVAIPGELFNLSVLKECFCVSAVWYQAKNEKLLFWNPISQSCWFWHSQHFIKEQIKQDEGAELWNTADVMLGDLHMMRNARWKRSHHAFQVFWMCNSETEKTQMNVATPLLGAEREAEVKGKASVDMSLKCVFKICFGLLGDLVVCWIRM